MKFFESVWGYLKLKNRSRKMQIDWKSKFLDFLIVVIGITIAFKLNTWNESRKAATEEKSYLISFNEESIINENNLKEALEHSKLVMQEIENIKGPLLSKNYNDQDIKILIGSMISMANFTPITTTMDNISASGEFDLITDMELRKNLIITYDSFKTTSRLEKVLEDYVDKYLTPFLLQNYRLNDLSPINSENLQEPVFENIVIGYEALLQQKINGYEATLERLQSLNGHLKMVKK